MCLIIVYIRYRQSVSMSGLLCPFCGDNYEATMTRFLNHVRLYHADSPNFTIGCNLQGCIRSFINFYTYRNHIYAIHGGMDLILEENPGNTISADSQDLDTVEEPPPPPPPFFPEDDLSCIQRAAATWILKVRETNLLPQSTMQSIIQDTESMYMVNTRLHDYSISDNYVEFVEVPVEIIIHCM